VRLDALIEGLEGKGVRLEVVRGDPMRVRVCDLTGDSRSVAPGSLFVARRGRTSDGRAFIADAVDAGATAVLAESGDGFDASGVPERAALLLTPDASALSAHLAERFYGEPSSKLPVVGVTGSNGKSTVAHLIHRTLRHAFAARAAATWGSDGDRDPDDEPEVPGCGLIGTVEIDDGSECAFAEMTTPPAMEISRTLGVMVESGCGAAVLETSSHALDQARVAAVKFDVGVFTNLSGEHADYHGSMEAYADAKAGLFEMLPESGRAIVNADDPASARMVRDCAAPVLRCSATDERAEAFVELEPMGLSGVRSRLRGPWGEMGIESPLLGAHNGMNLLQAAAGCWALGIETPMIEAGLNAAGAPAGRLERVSTDADDVFVFVDYAHTDDALARTLDAVRAAMPPGAGRLWVVFGAGGERDREKRPRMGRAAMDRADVVVLTSDNPRCEPPNEIIAEVLGGLRPDERSACRVHAERGRAIAEALRGAWAGDVVVVAGKGHEREQVLVNARGELVAEPFDDRERCRAALAERRRSVRA